MLINTKQKQSPSTSKSLTTQEVKKEEPKSFSWGNRNPTVMVQSPTQFSLLDVMNEEMSRVSLKSPANGESLKNKLSKATPVSSNPSTSKIQSQNENVQFKGWNIGESKQTKETSFNSFADIIEMEKRSKELYNKLKSRPLSVIQMEEKAIEDLKRLYDVDNVTNMKIKIELVDESEFKSAPIWKKN